jgi:predicted neuraminidase
MVRNKPIRLHNGEFLLPIYDEINWSAMVLISADEGDSWSVHGEVTAPTGCIQPTVIQRSDGELFMLLRRGRQSGCAWSTALSEQIAEGKVPATIPCAIWSATSSDNGRTWTATQPVDLPNPNAAIDMVQLENGHLLLAFNNSHRDRTPLSLALSTDEGRSWKALHNLEKDPGEYSYPAIIQARDGRVHVVYTYRREAIKHVVVSV